MGEFNVFIAWSGDTSKAVAKAWYDWLPLAIQSAKPWMSETNIPKGSPWFGELAEQLRGIRVGIICLTSDNLLAPSIHFEAGALSKTVADKAYVCPYLFHVKDSDLGFPLAHFQTTKMDRDDTERLFHTLSRALQAGLADEQLRKTFDRWWADLDSRLSAIAPPTGAEARPHRDVHEMLEELLELAHGEARRGSLEPNAPPDFWRRYRALDTRSVYAPAVYGAVPPPPTVFYAESYPPAEVPPAPVFSEMYGIRGEVAVPPTAAGDSPPGPVSAPEVPEELVKKVKK